MASRSSAIRSFVREMPTVYDCELDAEYYDDRHHWVIRWTDGPTRATVLAAVARQLPKHKGIVHAGRDLSDEATMLGAIRLYATGESARWRCVDGWAAGHHLEDVAHPLRTATSRELAMIERVLEESVQDTQWGRRRYAADALDLLQERHGIGWLLTSPVGSARQPEADAPGAAALQPSPIEALTARYARAENATTWRTRAEPMPVAEAFAAALADEEIDKDAALAALALVAELQAALDANTATLMDRARTADGSWSDVGRAMGGITKQSASRKYQVLASPDKPSANS
ncbi:hypothetical protein [Kitasatospora sp. NPDC098663]|uniref:hypothetical protein n=1 Tax=Kitasatospora sp. NPDC098663 TaxID=3364096 RepID=UPI0037FD42B5